MIHCVCNNINTACVDKAAACGATKAREVQSHCGTAFDCGQCKVSIQARLDLINAQPTMAEAAE